MAGQSTTTNTTVRGPGPAGRVSRLLKKDGFPVRPGTDRGRHDGVYVSNVANGRVCVTALFPEKRDRSQTVAAMDKALTELGYTVERGDDGVVYATPSKNPKRNRATKGTPDVSEAPKTAERAQTSRTPAPAVQFSEAPAVAGPTPHAFGSDDMAGIDPSVVRHYQDAGYKTPQAHRLAAFLANATN